MKWLSILERAAWTFIQAFSAAIVISGNLGAQDLKIAAVAAVISVAKNLSVKVDLEEKKR